MVKVSDKNMHDIRWIRENIEQFDKEMYKRGLEPASKRIVELDEFKRQLMTLIQRLQESKNKKVKEISKIFNKKSPEFEQLRKDTSDINAKLTELETQFSQDKELDNFLSQLPNILDEEVPFGHSEDENIEIKKIGTIRELGFEARGHEDLGQELGMIDFTQTAKISGTRFVTLIGDFARLERAVAQFFLDNAINKFGYTEVSPPLLVRDHAMYGVGQLPKFAHDSFETTNSYRLIPTAEVSLTNLVAEKTCLFEELPLRFTAHTPCFRSEAGSAGRDTKGMFRQHQFYKVELVSICTPETSKIEHERKLSAVEDLLQQLELPYRVMLLCSQDTGFSSRKTYDVEVWMPAQQKYREISSVSNCGAFQARRMKAKYRTSSGEREFVHTLNGSALAVGRALIAIIENYQNQDGSVTIPNVLRKYMDGKEIVHRR